MSVESSCALCSSAEATTMYDPPMGVARELTTERSLDVRPDEVVIPLCDGCQRRISKTVELMQSKLPDDHTAGNRRMRMIVSELNTITIEKAST